MVSLLVRFLLYKLILIVAISLVYACPFYVWHVYIIFSEKREQVAQNNICCIKDELLILREIYRYIEMSTEYYLRGHVNTWLGFYLIVEIPILFTRTTLFFFFRFHTWISIYLYNALYIYIKVYYIRTQADVYTCRYAEGW